MNILYAHAKIKTHRLTESDTENVNKILSRFNKCLDDNDEIKFIGLYSQLMRMIKCFNEAGFTVEIYANTDTGYLNLLIKSI